VLPCTARIAFFPFVNASLMSDNPLVETHQCLNQQGNRREHPHSWCTGPSSHPPASHALMSIEG